MAMIGRKVILTFSVNILKNALGYVGLFFVARYMGPTALGIIGFGFAYVGIFNFISDMGFGTAHIKRISEGKDLAKCVGTYLSVRSILTGGMAVSVLISIFVLKTILHKSFESSVHEHVIYLALFTMILGNFSSIISSTFAGKRETAKQSIPELISKIVEVPLKILVAVVGLGVVMLAGASVVGSAVCLAIFTVLFRQYSIEKPDWASVKDYWVFALPVMIIVSANAVTENLDKIMIQYFWSSDELGYYIGAHKISMIFVFIAPAVGTLVFPTISSYHSKNDIDSIRKLTHRAERYLSLLLLPIGVVLIFFGRTIAIILLGKEFYPSGQILSILAGAMIISIISVPYANQIIGTNKPKLSAVLSLVLMALNVSFNILFIPNQIFGIEVFGLGAYGAGLATLIATFLMALIYRFFAYKITHTPINTRVFRHLFASGLMALVIYVLLSRAINPGLFASLAIILVGLSTYTILLISFRELSKGDLIYLFDIISLSNMKSYISNEFGLLRPGKAK